MSATLPDGLLTNVERAHPELVDRASGRGDVVRDKPLITVAEAATLLGISASKGYELAREGALPGLVRLGAGHRQVVRAAVLRAWIEGADVAPVRPALRAVG